MRDMDVAAFYRGELLLDDDGVRAHCSGGPLEHAGEAYLFAPDAVWPEGWELEDRTIDLAEPVAHPLVEGRTLSVLPVGRGVRPEYIDQIMQSSQQLTGMLQLGAPEEMLGGARIVIESYIDALFGVETEPVELPDEDDAPEPQIFEGSIADVFADALDEVEHAELSATAGAYDSAMENLEIRIVVARGGKVVLRDSAWLHASANSIEADAGPVQDVVADYARMYVDELAAHVARAFARGAEVHPRGIAENFPPTFSAIDLLEKRAEEGEPEPSDLEPRKIESLAAAQVPKLPKKQAAWLAHSAVFAAFAIGDDTILLADAATGRPWSGAFVALVRDGELIPFLMTDEAGGTSQLLDGDPYRFRLVVAALRDAIRAHGLEKAVLAPLPMPIDTWLSFDLPDIGDRLVDPEQWFVAEVDDLPDDDAFYDGADTDDLRAAYHDWFESLPLR